MKNNNIKHKRVYFTKDTPEKKGVLEKLKFWKPKLIEVLALKKGR